MNTQDILEGVAFYRDAPHDVRSRVLAAARYSRLSPGELLFHEGEPVVAFAAVGSGSIRVSRIGTTGREITLYHVRAGEASLVAILSALLGRPSIATARAELVSEIATVPSAAVREWMSTDEALRRFTFETMARALVDVTTVIEDVAFRTMESRLATLLVQHADLGRVIPMRHEDIASELGTAREVVSRLLEGFERKGAITLARGRIEIRDESALRQPG
jgi:CRP/FNR family transcriptional regulator